MRDCVGREIHPNDIVVYGGGISPCFGRVTHLTEKRVSVNVCIQFPMLLHTDNPVLHQIYSIRCFLPLTLMVVNHMENNEEVLGDLVFMNRFVGNKEIPFNE